MGACWKSGTFIDTDWKSGIRIIQSIADEEYGHQEGYSGAENSCTYSYCGDMHTRPVEEVRAFLERQKNKLGSGEGGVVLIGRQGYENYSLVTTETTTMDRRLLGYIEGKGPAVAIAVSGMLNSKLGEGTIENLKKQATAWLQKPDNLDCMVFILSKNTEKQYRLYIKTTRSDKRLRTPNIIGSMPLNKYGYFGWCRE